MLTKMRKGTKLQFKSRIGLNIVTLSGKVIEVTNTPEGNLVSFVIEGKDGRRYKKVPWNWIKIL